MVICFLNFGPKYIIAAFRTASTLTPCCADKEIILLTKCQDLGLGQLST